LNNTLKGSLPPDIQDDIWRWAEDRGQELFRFNLEHRGDNLAEAIKGPYNSRREPRAGDERRVREAKIRLLKKTVAATNPIAVPNDTGRIGGLTEKIAECFKLKGIEKDILRLLVGYLSLSDLENLVDEVLDRNFRKGMTRKHFPAFGQLLGWPGGAVERALRRESPLLSNGLLSLDDDGEITFSDPLIKLVNQPRLTGQNLKYLILEKKTKASLTRAHFDYLEEEFDHLANLLGQALREGTRGLNILLYGPPGTGKTEMAKTLAAEIEGDLYPVSETSANNSQSGRRAELLMARTLVSGDPRAILMVDEAEDVLRPQMKDDGPSKLYFNRMLEKNETPVIWISNHVNSFDPAYLRRFTYALEVKTPPVPARIRIWRDELRRKKVKMTEKEIEGLAKNYELPPSFAVSAIKAARLLRDKGAIERTLKSLDYAITGKHKPIRDEKKVDFNPALLNTDTDLSKLTERILKGRMSNFSLCLFGAPGTGKSEYVRHLAERMGLEVLHQRASDLLSMWVGGSEKNIAEAFQKARDEKKFLIFDEADSLLQDRNLAFHSWEVTQVNEMLTWMESHPYPFACTTNLMEKLDPASLRRFTFKVKYDYLTLTQARLACQHFFGQDFEVKLEALTPGDFAVVARQAAIMGLDDPAELADLLAREQEAKGLKSNVIGFGV
jgi:SpoVK/Ycf46/Vps4 family AAA+-type ATPase